MHPFVPSKKPDRVVALDALRGLALLGILLANVPYSPVSGALDEFAEAGFHLFIDKKFIAIFSILFGLGCRMQLKMAERSGISFRPYFFRRMLLLLIIGCIHAYLFWFGDILRDYAIAGMLLLLIYKWSPKKLLLLGVAISVLGSGIVYVLNALLEIQRYDYDTEIVLEHLMTGSYLRYLEINATIDPFMNFVQDKPIALVFCAGNMLIGFALGQLDFFSEPKSQEARAWLIAFGSTAGLGCSFLFWKITSGKLELTPELAWLPTIIVAGVILQSLFYISLFMWLFEKTKCGNFLEIFAPLGRMALTNYICQTFFYLLVFFHATNGLKLHGRTSVSGAYLLAVIFFILQVLASRWWLKRHAQGPVEQIWKKMAYASIKRRPQAV
jgi:uncharacterized protein